MMAAGAIDVCNYDASWGGGQLNGGGSPRLPPRSTSSSAITKRPRSGPISRLAAPRHLRRAFSPARDPIFWHMIENRPALVDGQFALPERPGLGWVLDEAFIEKHRVDR